MTSQHVNRREFVQMGATATAAATVGLSSMAKQALAAKRPPAAIKTRSFNPEMEYRRLGKTNIWVSAICLGGHWKRIDKVIGSKSPINPYEGPSDKNDENAFFKNRHDVVSRCIERGINCIDFAGNAEPETYCRVLKGRRDKMYLCYSHPASELRVEENRTTEKLLELFAAGLKRCGLEYADVWRLMALERGGNHSSPTSMR